MDLYLPPFVEAERGALLAEIEAAFDGVRRDGGVSWAQSRVLDDYGTEAEMAAALRLDQDSRWQDLLAPGAWDPERSVGGFSFLDAVGFRYYLPAAMVLSVRQGWDAGILFHLRPFEGELQAHRRTVWSELDARQARCVRRYLDYMLVVDGLSGAYCRDDHLAALDGYWRAASEDGGFEAQQPKAAMGRKAARRAR